MSPLGIWYKVFGGDGTLTLNKDLFVDGVKHSVDSPIQISYTEGQEINLVDYFTTVSSLNINSHIMHTRNYFDGGPFFDVEINEPTADSWQTIYEHSGSGIKLQVFATESEFKLRSNGGNLTGVKLPWKLIVTNFQAPFEIYLDGGHNHYFDLNNLVEKDMLPYYPGYTNAADLGEFIGRGDGNLEIQSLNVSTATMIFEVMGESTPLETPTITQHFISAQNYQAGWVDIHFTEVPNADYYKIFERIGEDFYVFIGTATSSPHVMGFSAGKIYTIVVKAYSNSDSYSESEYSNEYRFWVQPTIDGDPGGTFGGGTGTIMDPFTIMNAVQLNNVRNYLNNPDVRFQIIRDIDMSTYSAGEGFTPIGDATNRFRGKLIGNGHVVKGLYMNKGLGNLALFQYVGEEAEIKGIRFTDVSITGYEVAVVAYNNSGKIHECHLVSGTVTGSKYAAGIAVYNGGNGEVRSNITNNRVDINLAGDATDQSGIAVWNDYLGDIVNNIFTGGVTSGSGSVAVGNNAPTGIVESTYFDTQKAGRDDTTGMGKTTSELRTPEIGTGIYSDWDPNVWYSGTFTEYPALKMNYFTEEEPEEKLPKPGILSHTVVDEATGEVDFEIATVPGAAYYELYRLGSVIATGSTSPLTATDLPKGSNITVMLKAVSSDPQVGDSDLSEAYTFIIQGGNNMFIKFQNSQLRLSAASLAALTDVDLTGVKQGSLLRYNATTEKMEVVSEGKVLPFIDGYAATAPGTPSVGMRILVAENATDAFAGHDFEIATYTGSSWNFSIPELNSIALIGYDYTESAAMNKVYGYTAQGWGPVFEVEAGGISFDDTNSELGVDNVQDAIDQIVTDMGTAGEDMQDHIDDSTIHLNASDVNGLIDAELTAQKGANNGLAPLDAGGKIAAQYLPNSVMEYHGNWDPTTNTPSLADGTGNAGDVYIASEDGTVDLGSGDITFAQGDWVIYSGSIWEKSINSNKVASVNGQTGAVDLDQFYYTKSEIDGKFDNLTLDDVQDGTTYKRVVNVNESGEVTTDSIEDEAVTAAKLKLGNAAGDVNATVIPFESINLSSTNVKAAIEEVNGKVDSLTSHAVIRTFTAGEAITEGMPVAMYHTSGDSKVYKGQGIDTGHYKVVGIALGSAAADEQVAVVLFGYIESTAFSFAASDIAKTLYLSPATAGALVTELTIENPGELIAEVGIVVAANAIIVRPQVVILG
ncbi:MAG: hypothetical protein WCY49_07045 [Anaerovoracaceae bacterium]